ncbi:hypothetical protein EDC04DRAFT_2869309 [Pisolithus marmoratus]|nr:hypothetical protein EDC04DRAFT_2869309 [Pisolithus marmoratus]
MAYVPEHAYADAKGEKHIYDEMWTGDWWWDVQTKLPKGTVIAPVILSSDKTSLLVFSGDKKAWPVYLTIGNILKDVRCQVSAHAMVLIGYLPVLKLKCFHKKTCSLAGYQLFHHAMSLVIQPLINARCHSKEMVCANGYLHQVHPILTAYVTNFPEQCLVACNKENKCGDLEEYAWQRMMDTLKTLWCKQRNKQSRRFDTEGLCTVYKPFWKDLPFCDIFTCITPDILHQLHKGIFHDHLLQWCTSLMGKKEIDACFQAKGISMIPQWTGTKHKEMQWVFDGILLVTHSLLDFIYYAQFQQHMDTTLEAMQDSLKTFHNYKHVLVEMEVHQDFNLPKLHSLQHYDTYQASNKQDYVEQMALSTYLAWRKVRNYTDEHPDEGHLHAEKDVVSGLVAYYKVAKMPPHCQPIESDQFDLYNQLYIKTGPSVITGHGVSMQKVHVSPRVASHGHKAKVPAHFDTVFMLDEGYQHVQMLMPNTVQVAQVCVIFKLLEHFGAYLHPLTYVKWFTALCCHDTLTGLYVVNCST